MLGVPSVYIYLYIYLPNGFGEDSARIRRGFGEDSARTRRGLGEDSARTRRTRLFPKSGKRDEKKKREDVREESQDLPKGGVWVFRIQKMGLSQ